MEDHSYIDLSVAPKVYDVVKMSKREIRKILELHEHWIKLHEAVASGSVKRVEGKVDGVRSAMLELLDGKPLQQLEHLTSTLHSLIQTVEGQAGALNNMSYDIQSAKGKAAEATDMAKRAFDLCHDIQNKLDNYNSPVLMEEATSRIGCLTRQVEDLQQTLDDPELQRTMDNLVNRMDRLELEVASLDLLHKKDDEAQQAFNRAIERRIGIVQVTTDNPKPLPESTNPTNISIYKLMIPNTQSANLYWRRGQSGQLHLCELGSDDRAHPCCGAVDFPDTGRATKEQPKAYCGSCLQIFYTILCEGK